MADEIRIEATFDASQLITGLQQMVSNFEANTERLTASLQSINTKSEALAEELQGQLSATFAGVEASLQGLISANSEYLRTTTALSPALQQLRSAESEVAAAESLVQEARQAGVTGTKDLAVASELLQGANTNLQRSTQEYAASLEANLSAEGVLSDIRLRGAIAAQNLSEAQLALQRSSTGSAEAQTLEATAARVSGQASTQNSEAKTRLIGTDQQLVSIENELRTSQLSYATTSSELGASLQKVEVAEREVEGAESAVQAARAAGVAGTRDLVVATNSLQEVDARLQQTIQEYGSKLEQVATAERQLTAVRESAVTAGLELAGVQENLLSKAQALQGPLQQVALSTTELATAQGSLAEASSSLQSSEQQLAGSEAAAGESAERSSVMFSSLAEARERLAASSQRLVAAEGELASAQSSTATTAGEYLAAIQEQAAAQAEVTSIQDVLQAKIASLQAQLAEEGAILADTSTTWVEYAAAQTEAATVTQELVAAQGVLAEQTLAAATASASNTTAQTAQATATQQLGVVSTQTTQILTSVNTVLQQVGAQTRNVAGAISLLGNQNALLNTTAQGVTNAINTVNTALQKYGLQLQGTAGQLQLVNLATQNVNNSTQQFNGTLAYVTARLAAYLTGLGPVGFALGTLARSATSLGPILAVAFPVIGAIALADVAVNLIEKFIKLGEETRRLQTEMADLAISQEMAADSLALQTLKLEDQIAKYEGRPNTNRLKEAAIESRIEVDKLVKSLGDAVEKEVDLLDKADVGVLTSLFSGAQPTSLAGSIDSSFGNLKEKLGENSTALLELRVAYRAVLTEDNVTTQAAFKNAQARVEATRKEVSDETALLKTKFEAQGQSATKSREFFSLLGQVVQGNMTAYEAWGQKSAAALELEKKARESATGSVRQHINALTEEDLAIAQQTAQLKELSEFLKKIDEEKKAADADEKRRRNKAVEEPDIKNALEAAKQQVAIKKQIAEDNFKATEESVKLEVQQEVEGGELKEDAEIASNDKLVAARTLLTNELLDADSTSFDAELKSLTKHLEKVNSGRWENGVEQIADRKNLQAQIERLWTQHYANQISIAEQGDAALARLAGEDAQHRFELQTKVTNLMVSNIRNSIREQLEIAKSEESETSTKAQSKAENQLRVVQTYENLKLITMEEAKNRRISILDEEQAAVDAAFEKEKAVIQERMEFLKKQEREVPPNQIGALKELETEYSRLEVDLQRVATAQDNFNTKVKQQKIDVAVKEWADYQKAVDSFVTSSEGAFNGFVENVVTANRTIAEDFREMVLSMERDFLKMILSMIEHSALFNAVDSKIRSGIGKIFGLPSKAPGDTGGAGEEEPQKLTANASTQTAIVGQQASTNAQLAALYQQDVAAYLSAQTQKLTGHAAEENTKTAATTTGVATRTGVESVGTAKDVAQSATKTAAHTTSEVHKTVATTAGESTRTGIISAHTLHHIALKTTETVHHIASEIQKTVSTVSHEAIRIASAIANFVKKLIFGTHETTKTIADDTSKTTSAVATNAIVLASTLTTNAAILTSNIATSLGSITADKTAGAAKLGTEVALAGAGGVASMAAAPFPIDLTAPAFGAAMAATAASFGGALALAEGGHVAGPGTSTSDSIPAMLSDGEYVINADSVKKMGVPLLNLINKGDSLHVNTHAFAQGGLVRKSEGKGAEGDRGAVARDSLHVGSSIAEAHRMEFLKSPSFSSATGLGSTLSNISTLSRPQNSFTTSNTSKQATQTIHVQPEINYHQHGEGPDMNEFHDTILKAVKSALRKGQINPSSWD